MDSNGDSLVDDALVNDARHNEREKHTVRKGKKIITDGDRNNNRNVVSSNYFMINIYIVLKIRIYFTKKCIYNPKCYLL